MRAYVFTDETLAGHAGRFVWLALDTEKAANAPLRKKLPVEALPTYFVVDPASEKVALRWVGGATASQLAGILDEGRLAVAARGGRPAKGAPRSEAADTALARADRLYGEGNNAEAAGAYREAIAAAPADWPRYGRAVESALFALYRAGDHEPAALLAREAFPRLRRSPSAVNVAALGLDCALALPAERPRRAELAAALEAGAREVVADTALAIAADDRSGVYAALLGARKDARDERGARETAAAWAAFLEGEAARAATADQRAVFDSHRLSAYLELGEPERALPMLAASERDLPDDYNPPARLAVALKAMGRWDDALAASDRALAKAYGPRRLGMLQVRAEIHEGRGDLAAARRTLEDAIGAAEALPEGQRSEARIAALRKRLEGLGK